MVQFFVQGQEMKWDGPAQILRQEKRGDSLLPLPFVLFGPSMGGMMSTHVGEGPLLYLVHQCRCCPHPKLPHPEIEFNLGTPRLVRLTHKIHLHKWH